MVISQLATKTYKVRSNQPFLLLNPQVVWRVVSGQVAVFTTQIEACQPRGERHYLFDVNPGEILSGVNLDRQLGLLAVPLEDLELQRYSLDELDFELVNKNIRATTLLVNLEDWCKKLVRSIASQAPQNLLNSGAISLAPCSLPTPYSFNPGQCIQSPPSQTVWVKVKQGLIAWQGSELTLDRDSPQFPLFAGTWLTAESAVEIEIIPTFNYLYGDRLTTSLELFHHYCCQVLNRYLIQQKQAEFARFQARERLNSQLTTSAIGKLASVLEPQQTIPSDVGSPLLIAVGAIGRYQKIDIKPPAASEDLDLISHPLEAIARASQCRIRQVKLSDSWWQQEHGAILAYTVADGVPVALLPNLQGKGYLLFDPIFQTRIIVDREIAQTVGADAYVFYRSLPLKIDSIIQLFQFGIEGYQKDALLVILIGILTSILGMVAPQATGILIDKAIPDSDRLLLWQVGLALLAAALGNSAFQLSQGIITLRIENATDVNLQLAVWDRLLKSTPAFFRQYTSGELVNRLLAVRQIRRRLSGATQRTLFSGIFSLLNLLLMCVYSFKLALIVLGITIFTLIITVTSAIFLIRQERQQEILDGELDGLTVQLIGGVAKLRVAAAEERAFATWADKYSQKTQFNFRIQAINDRLSTFNEALPLISSILLFWFAVSLINAEQTTTDIAGLTPGTFLSFNVAFGIFISGVTDLSNTLTDILGIVPLWERAKSIVRAPLEYNPQRTDAGRLAGRIVIDRLSFRYRQEGAPILDNVSLRAEPGEFIAVVGSSGSGKSTLFRLLLGFENPQSGAIYYDGQDLSGLDVTSVRRQLGVVLQNGRLQQSSIFDNIACGALLTLEQAWQAAAMAGIAEDIEQMPMGMHTVVSEGGSNLSGGQRQRLLIARALVGNPQIILMDEATSALDNRTQATVTQSIETLNATRIVIAHRLSTIRHADRIYVLEAGRIVQAGSFAELIAQAGLFSRLVARQLE